MSRRDFREPVSVARPRAALAMVALATTTLGITGQILPWALALAAIALAAASTLRTRPRTWQQSGPLLNTALAGTLGVGAALFVQGEIALIAIAHFAVLAQGLQLLDARPRRSEFLLVALALFQVVLAANLTDSALFPLLLVAFTVATVWTLVVHTLHAEALEAGRPEAASRALSGSLRRTVTLASLASVAMALVLFPLLPRIRGGLLLSGPSGNAVAVSGFSDNVELGDLGRIRLDPQVVLRVETLDGDAHGAAERYVRGLAFDHFDGRRWSVTPPGRARVPGDPEIGVDLGRSRRGARLVQRIARERMQTGVIFAAGVPNGVRGPLGRLEVDAGGSLHAHRTANARVDYTVVSRIHRPGDEALRADRAEIPADDGGRHLRLPPLSPRTAERARRVTADARSDGERALALERYLRREGRYSDHPPRLPPGTDQSPVEVFLEGGLEGHCEYFASSMTVLARSLGLPSRVVNGFAGGRQNSLGGFVEYAQSDAHTWVEVHFAEAGWVRFDPTPPDLRMAGADALRGAGGLSELASALELWWFRNVVDFDRGHQARALHRMWRRWRDWRRGTRGASPGPTRPRERGGSTAPPTWVWALPLLLGLGAAWWRRRRSADRVARLPEWYGDALRLLAARGLERGPAVTARDFAHAAAAALPAQGASAFYQLTEAYLRVRFGPDPGEPGDRQPGRAAADRSGTTGRPDRELARLRDSLRG